MVENLRGISRDDNRQCECMVNIVQIVRDALTIIGHQIHNYTDHFDFDLPNPAIFVIGNHQQLEQVVINLVMNALQSLPNQERGIRVSIGQDEGASVIMTIQDEGRGIKPEIIERISEPFFSTRLDEGGTGLGLSISAAIIKDHNGSMEFFSEVDKGTKVVVTLQKYHGFSAETASENGDIFNCTSKRIG